ncbi:MAG: YeeE/YedE thiosulfate transporter family protein, partial [Candidatus Rokuibacteriota bacterium]
MDDLRWTMFVSALSVGLLFGYVIQRGGFCLTRALGNLVLSGDATILRAWVLALLVAIIGVQVLVSLGLVDIPIRSFRWLANILGGLLFGVGMILAGGCAASTWYRVGEGAIGALVVLLGFAISASVVGIGA